MPQSRSRRQRETWRRCERASEGERGEPHAQTGDSQRQAEIAVEPHLAQAAPETARPSVAQGTPTIELVAYSWNVEGKKRLAERNKYLLDWDILCMQEVALPFEAPCHVVVQKACCYKGCVVVVIRR